MKDDTVSYILLVQTSLPDQQGEFQLDSIYHLILFISVHVFVNISHDQWSFNRLAISYRRTKRTALMYQCF